MPRIGTDSKGNREVKRVELKQRTVQLVLPPANVQRSFRQVLTSDTMPNTRHWQCNDHASDFIDWIGTPPTPSRQSRFVSQNVGPVGIRNSIPTVQRILSSHNPAVVLLQDCQAKNSARAQVHAQFRKEWPQYQIFIRCGTRMRGRSNSNRSKKNKHKHTYHYSAITMVHKSAGSTLDSFQHVKADGFDEGYLLTVKIRPDRGPVLFVSNVYNHVAAENKQHQALLDQLGARLLHTESLGHVHLAGLAGGDYNASLSPEARKGYSNSCETKEADVHFQKFTLDPQRSVVWWTGHIIGGIFTRRSPHAQATRLDEISSACW